MNDPALINIIYGDDAHSDHMTDHYEGFLLSPGPITINRCARSLILLSEEISTTGQRISSVIRRFKYAMAP